MTAVEDALQTLVKQHKAKRAHIATQEQKSEALGIQILECAEEKRKIDERLVKSKEQLDEVDSQLAALRSQVEKAKKNERSLKTKQGVSRLKLCL